MTKEKDLQNGERKREKSRPENREAEQRRDGKNNISKYDQTVVQRYSVLPSEAAKESGALIFFVGRKSCEVDDKKICKRKSSERNDNDHQQTMIFFGLKKETNGRDDVSDVRGESEFTEAAVEQADGRNGIGENENDG